MARTSARSLLEFAKRHRWSLTLSVLSLVCFVRLGSEIQDGELDTLDGAVTRMISVFRGRFDGVMVALTWLGNGVSLLVLSVLVCALLVVSGRRREASFLAVSATGAALLNGALKLVFHRARPGLAMVYLATEPSSVSHFVTSLTRKSDYFVVRTLCPFSGLATHGDWYA